MTEVKSTFNYITYTFIFCIFLFFATVTFFFPKGFLLVIQHEANHFALYIGALIAAIGLIYGLIVALDLLLNYRRKVSVSDRHLSIRDAIFFTKEEIDLGSVKYYYEDTYVYNWMFKAIVFELNTGRRVKVLNFFTWNYRDWKASLSKLKIKRLRTN